MGAVLSLQPSYYEALRRLTLELSGVSLGKAHKFLIETRLGALARKEGFESLSDMVDELFSRGQTRLAVNVVSALLQQEKTFFDDKSGFEALEQHVLENLMRRFGSVPLRALVFGCGAGQDAYALAMTAESVKKRLPGFALEIVAVDYPSWALDRARDGKFTHFEIQRGLPIRQLVTYFDRVGENWAVKDALKSQIEFRDWHLMSSPEKLGQFHLILFRNMMPRYSGPAKIRLLRGLMSVLHIQGCLVLGSDEDAREFVPNLLSEPQASGVFRRGEADTTPHPDDVIPMRKDFIGL